MIGNIMIIDDSPIDRKIIVQILRKQLPNVKFFEAENGKDINHKLIINDIHVCIVDIVLPDKNGFEIIKEVKKNKTLSDIPIIVFTGIDNKQAINEALSLGVYDYFSKPLSEEEMKVLLPLKVKNALQQMKRKEVNTIFKCHGNVTSIYNRRF